MKAHNASRIGASASTALQCQTNPPQRILVVEDEPDIRNLDIEVLRGSGFQVDTAENGLVALRLIDTGNYDLLIVEDEMKMVAGLELVSKLRSEDYMVPVILVLETIPVEKPIRNPWPLIQALLFKPYAITELCRTVSEVLQAATKEAKYPLNSPTNWQGPICSRWVAVLKM